MNTPPVTQSPAEALVAGLKARFEEEWAAGAGDVSRGLARLEATCARVREKDGADMVRRILRSERKRLEKFVEASR
jgi:hypothetical protein